MTYRVFVGSPAVYHGKARTKHDAIEMLHNHINAMRSTYESKGDKVNAERYARYTLQLASEADRIKRERFKPMPSGLHGPLYKAPFGSICTM